MPKRKYSKRKPRRRRRYRKNQVSNIITVRGPKVIPDRYRCKMTHIFTTTATAGSTDTIIRANSVYDPEFAAGGGQPTGFDELAALYSRYLVNAAKVKVTLVNYSATAAKLVVSPSPDSSSFSSILAAATQPYAKQVIVGGSSGASMRSVSLYMTTKAARGLNGNSPIADDELEATTTANPTKQWFFHVVHGHLDGTSASNQEIQCEITYYVDFFKRHQITLS